MQAGPLAALVAAGLAKAVGSTIAANADLGFLEEFLKAGFEVAGKAADGPIASWVNSWLRPQRRKRLLERATWYDLAGLAWGEHLYETDDAELIRAFDATSEQVRSRLDAEWFVELMVGPRGREVAVPRDEPGYGAQLDPAFVGALAELLAVECAERLATDDLPELRGFLVTVIDALPKRIARLALQVPGADARLARLLLADRVVPSIERLLEYADGTAASKEALRHMERLSAAVIATEDRDTFGRSHFEDLPKLPHRAVYVEPDAGRAGERSGPATARIRAAWDEAPFVVLRAPFGMGKSLTCRELGIQLAREWREDPRRPFPLRLDCPELFLGNVSALRDAVARHLEADGFGEDAARWLWSKAALAVLLDGFDEVAQPPERLRRWIEDMVTATRRDGLRLLLCTRHYGYESVWVTGERVELDLQPLGDSQAREWLDRHGRALGKAPPTLEAIQARLDDELSCTPILLLMAVYTWDQPSEDGLQGKTALYARFVDRLSTGKWAEVQGAHPAIAAAQTSLGEDGTALFQEALARIAWTHLVHTGIRGEVDGRALPLRALHDTLAGWRKQTEAQIAELARALMLSLFFRKNDVHGDLRFSHRSFREFLCARYLLTQARRLREEPAGHRLLSALVEADPGRETLTFLAELLRPHPELLHLTLATVEAAFDRSEEVAFFGRGVRVDTWDGRPVVLVSDDQPHTNFLTVCDTVSVALRRQERDVADASLGGGWVRCWNRDQAWHRETGRQALFRLDGQGDPTRFNRYPFDGHEERDGHVLYWLEGMTTPRVTHSRLAALWGGVGGHLASVGLANTPHRLALRTTDDGRWLIGGRDHSPPRAAWARTVWPIVEGHRLVQSEDPRMRQLRIAVALAAEGPDDLAPSWSELLERWSWFVERCQEAERAQ